MTTNKALTTKASENFVAKMVSEAQFTVTPEQRELIQGYFVAMDHYLSDNNIPWNDVIVDYKLAQDLMVRAQMGFDMRSEAMLYPVARKDNKNGGKLRFTIQKGYKGYVFEAKKYAAGTLIDIDAHLVYENDEFCPHFKDQNHPYDTFEFNPPKNVFVDRGKIVGGFAYATFENEKQNKLIVMSKAEIDKHRAVAQTSSFWGKWYEQMALKTLFIAAAKAVPKDPSKIDSTYRASQLLDQEQADAEAQENILINQETGEVIDLNAPKAAIPQSTNVDMPVRIEAPVQAEKVPAGNRESAAATEEMMNMEF